MVSTCTVCGKDCDDCQCFAERVAQQGAYG